MESPEQLIADKVINSRIKELSVANVRVESAMRGIFTAVQISASPPIEQRPVQVPNHAYNPTPQPNLPSGKEKPTTTSAAVEAPNTYVSPSVGVPAPPIEPVESIKVVDNPQVRLLEEAHQLIDEAFDQLEFNQGEDLPNAA